MELKKNSPKNTGNLRRSIRVKVLPSVTKSKLRAFLYNGAKGGLDAYDISMLQYGWIIDNWQSSGNIHRNWIRVILTRLWGESAIRRGRSGRGYRFAITFNVSGFGE